MIPVALCFAINNVLTAFGTSGRSAGKPDVPTVLALILQKLVVPVSLLIESLYVNPLDLLMPFCLIVSIAPQMIVLNRVKTVHYL